MSGKESEGSSSDDSRSRSRSRKRKKKKKKSKKKKSQRGDKRPRSLSPDPLSQEAKRLACTVHVGNLPAEMSSSLLIKFLHTQIPKYDKTAVRNVQLFSDQSRALVEFRTPTAAETALTLDGKLCEGLPLRVRWPKSSELRSAQGVPLQPDEALDKIFLGGLPAHLGEDVILQVCRQFGELSGFTLVRDRLTGLPRDFAFLSYRDPATSARAISRLDGMELGGRNLVCRLARQKTGVDPVVLPTREEPLENVNNLRLGASSQALMKARMNNLLGIASQPCKKPDTRGIGMYADREQPLTLFQREQRSCVIMLLNMVTAKELADRQEYKDILEDIKSECQKFGKIQRLVIPRPCTGSHPDTKRRLIDADVGKIFVEYASPAHASAALAALAGRAFACRVVVAAYVTDKEWARILSTHAS